MKASSACPRAERRFLRSSPELEAGESLAGKGGPLAPVDLIAALAAAALGDENPLGPASVQAKPRRPRLARALSEPAMAAMFPSVPHPMRLALAAGLLQVHDFWDASHEAAQQADDRGERGTSAYWHGIAHRREPDAGNAAYWFRRVGRHPVFVPLAQAAGPCCADGRPGGACRAARCPAAWNPSAMTELCTTRRRPGTRRGSDLRDESSAWRCGSCSRRASRRLT